MKNYLGVEVEVSQIDPHWIDLKWEVHAKGWKTEDPHEKHDSISRYSNFSNLEDAEEFAHKQAKTLVSKDGDLGTKAESATVSIDRGNGWEEGTTYTCEQQS